MAIIEIRREDVQRLVAQGAQLAEVLSRRAWEHEHIAGALSVPLDQFPAEAARLRRDHPVIVYCYDYQ